MAGAAVVAADEGELGLQGLDADVEVLRDARGIPTILAETSHDLFYAQGYVHAQDRFWEMDVRRHITAGRLSEMFGDAQVETDTFVRTLGWRDVAEAELELLTPETLDALQAYADGVNAYLAERRHPGEPGVRPPRSHRPRLRDRAVDAGRLGVVAQGDGVGPAANLEEETQRALLVPTVRSRIAQLYPPYPYERHDADRARQGTVSTPIGSMADRTVGPSGESPAVDSGAAAEPVCRAVRRRDQWCGTTRRMARRIRPRRRVELVRGHR